DQLARDLARRAVAVAVPESDVGFFVERGYRRAPDGVTTAAAAPAPPAPTTHGAPASDSAAALVHLLPPDPATAIPAVSVALVDPLRRRVLVGRRKQAPYDAWWAFPGGKVMAGEDVRAAAARELAEETGITLPDALRPR